LGLILAKLIELKNLKTNFYTRAGVVRAVNGVDFTIEREKTLGVVGESGCGKSVTALSIMGLIQTPGLIETGEILLHQNEGVVDLTRLNPKGPVMRSIRGNEIAMIFQDPMTSLNPYLRISRQMTEVLVEHRGCSETEAAQKSIDLLDLVGIPEPKERFRMYPHEFSGGMRQRVMIAMALLCEPQLLIADEPTTALDVTVQAQILDLIARLGRELNMATVLITHDLGVIAGLSDRVVVMYGGRIVEEAPVDKLFKNPCHPYTRGLLESMPRIDEISRDTLYTISGQPPDLQALPSGCSFEPRCEYAFERCQTEIPELRRIDEHRVKACHLDQLK
jgi:oligopeptide transport system ATP-binding protein